MKNLGEITHDLDIVTKQYVDDAAETKVDKVEGKQLSTNDFTDEYKNKLEQLGVVQVFEIPTASADNVGKIIQYIGVTNTSYTNGFFYKNGEITQEDGTKSYSWMNIKVQDSVEKYTLPEIGESQNIETLYGDYTLTTKSIKRNTRVYSTPWKNNRNADKLGAEAISFDTDHNKSCFNVTVDGITKIVVIEEGEGSWDRDTNIKKIMQAKIDALFGAHVVDVHVSLNRRDFDISFKGSPDLIPHKQISISAGTLEGYADTLALWGITEPQTNILDTEKYTIADLIGNVSTTETVVINDFTMTLETSRTIKYLFDNLAYNGYNTYYSLEDDAVIMELPDFSVTSVTIDCAILNALGIYTMDNTSEYFKQGSDVNVVNVTKPDGSILENIALEDSAFDFEGNLALLQILQKENTGTVDYNALENLPSINGVEVKGDITAQDLGINDTNVYYGEEEPTADNVVMWIDPTGTGSIEDTSEQINNLTGSIYSVDRYNIPMSSGTMSGEIGEINRMLNINWDFQLPLNNIQNGKQLDIEIGSTSVNYKDTVFTSNILPTFTSAEDVDGWHVTANANAQNAWKAFDKNASTSWSTNEAATANTLYNLDIELPEGKTIINPTIKVVVSVWNTTSHYIYFRGYNPATQSWINVGYVSGTGYATDVTKTFTFTDGIEYTKLSVMAIPYSTSYYPTCTSFECTSGTLRDYNNNNTLDVIDTTTSNIYVTLGDSVNQKLNCTDYPILTKGERYNLVYNGNSWDIIDFKNHVVGVYTGDGKASQIIELGFTPSAVLVSGDSYLGYDFQDAFAIKSYPCYAYGGDRMSMEILNNGFKVYYNSSNNHPKVNTSGDIYRYIAFK